MSTTAPPLSVIHESIKSMVKDRVTGPMLDGLELGVCATHGPVMTKIDKTGTCGVPYTDVQINDEMCYSCNQSKPQTRTESQLSCHNTVVRLTELNKVKVLVVYYYLLFQQTVLAAPVDFKIYAQAAFGEWHSDIPSSNWLSADSVSGAPGMGQISLNPSDM